MSKVRVTKAAQGASTRERLINAARPLFAERGYDALSLDDVLRVVGLTKGAIYHHFGDKKGLFREVVMGVQGEVAREAKRAGDAQNDPVDALQAVCSSFFRQLQKPDVMRIVCRDAGVFLSWAECTAIDEKHMLAVMRDFIGAAQTADIFPPLDLEASTRVITGAIYQTVEWASHGETTQRIAAGEAVLMAALAGLARR